jgi:precorrin-6A/cobalt-precorrin-6A reductase
MRPPPRASRRFRCWRSNVPPGSRSTATAGPRFPTCRPRCGLSAPCRAFLALGRNELAPFAAAPQHFYLIRSVDPVEPPLAVPQAVYLTGRGPFDEADERRLLAEHRIDVIVAKNSGGAATYGKIAAARALGLPVIVLARPARPQGPAAASVEEALARLDHALTSVAARGV